MNNKLFKKIAANKRILIIAAIIIVIAIIAVIVAFSGKDSGKADPSPKKPVETTEEDSKAGSGSAVDASTSGITVETGTLSMEDAPEPTLDPKAANDVILESDPEPEITLKTNQKTFNDCMEAGDYTGAKEVLDSYFATDQYAISGVNTYDNYVYYYEKQGLYKESAMYQIDFLEREMGLDNIVEGNTRYQKLLETIKYVKIDDPRLEKMAASVKRWKEIQELLDAGKNDEVIEKIKSYTENGLEECVYAYHFIAKAYGAKEEYVKQARAYYIFLTRLSAREPNTLELSFQPVFLEHAYALYDMYLISDEERDLLQDTITADSLP